MAGVMYVLVSLYLPSSKRLIFGVDKGSGEVRLVRNSVTFLPPHRFYQLSFDKREGAAQRDGLIRITSKEGVPVTITYRLRFGIEGARIPDSQRLVSNGWNAWIRARVSEAVSAVTRQVPIEELLAPTSQFNRRRQPLRDVVARHLGQNGLNVTAFEIVRMDADREALLRYKRAELRRSARGVAGRVAIFAIDGADWDLITELADDGRIPNIRALARGGATGSLQTIQPTVSPLVWTTMATGVTPDRHGVIDFVDRTANRPVDGWSRRSPALWEISEAFGRHAAVVNWWTAWPPAKLPTAVFGRPLDVDNGGIHPPELEQQTKSAVVPLATVGYEQVGRFLNVTRAEYDAAVNSNNSADPVNVFRRVLAKTWTDHRVGMQLYASQSPLLTMVAFDGADAVNHLFAPYHPPLREGVSSEGYRRYWPAVANYYSEVDRLIGEWMGVLSEDTTVIIVSAHGFRWSQNRPKTQPAGRSSLSDHRNPGIFIAYGNHVSSRTAGPVSIYDVAPTVLAILGLPASADMPGKVATTALNIAPVESVRVLSYSEFFDERRGGGGQRDAAGYQAALQAVGHLTDPSRTTTPVLEDDDSGAQTAAAQPVPQQVWASYAWYNNQGIQLRKEGKHREAIESFQKAIDLNPARPSPYLNMAMALFDRQQYTAADDVFVQAVAKGLPNADRWFVDFASLYRQNDMPSRAIVLLQKGKQIFPQSYLIAANLGSALASSDRYTEALPELERALGLQPSSTLTMNNLGALYAKRKDWGRALDFWNRSLAIDGRQVEVRRLAEAAQSQL